MADNLRSRCDGRAIAGAGNHVRRCFRASLREFDEMRRAGGGRNAPSQDEVVGRVLALAAQPGTDHPRQRVEPPDAAQRLGRHLQQPVAVANVRQLVQQHDAHPLRRPLGRCRRQHDGRPPPAPRRHQSGTRTEQQVDAASQAARTREVGAQAMPRPIRHEARRRAEPAEPRQPDQKHAGAGDRARQPDRHGQQADDMAARDGRHGASGPAGSEGCPSPTQRRVRAHRHLP